MRRLCALIVVVAAACAPARPEIVGAPADAAEVVAASPDAAAAADVTTAPRTIRLAADTDWDRDPATAGTLALSRRVLADLAYRGLTRVGPLGDLEGDLAETWTVSDDGLVWTFHLDPDARAADGSALDASRVVARLDAIVGRGGADQAASLLWPVEGWDDRTSGASSRLAGVTAPSPTAVEIRLDRAFAPLAWTLADPALGITWTDPEGGFVATGDFVWDGDALVGVDEAVSGLRVEPVPGGGGPESVADAFATGELDWAVLTPGAPSVDIPGDTVRVPLDAELGLAVLLADAAQRRAVAAALDPAELRVAVPGLIPTPIVSPSAEGSAPASVVVASGTSALEPLAAAVAAELTTAGIATSVSSVRRTELATALAGGEVGVVPLVVGARGPAAGSLRAFVPGAVDEVWGWDDPTWAALAADAAAAGGDERLDAIDDLVSYLEAEGVWVPLGRFEARVAVAPSVRGLTHNPDGTLDLGALVG